MKKYWKIIVLPLFIIVVFTVFYISEKSISKQFPQFTFEKIEGNEKTVDSLIVNGDLFRGMFRVEPFSINQDGTTYFRDESFFTRLSGYYQPLEITRLQKEHRNFMRGKEQLMNFYAETDEILAYGAVPYDILNYETNLFEIAVLDKETDQSTAFTVPIPHRNDYLDVDVSGVFFENHQLTMVTVNQLRNAHGYLSNTEVHVYTFDIEKEQLINDHLVATFSANNENNGYENTEITFNDLSAENEIIISHSDITFNESGDTAKFNKIVKYHLETNEIEEIPVPEDQQIGKIIAFTDDELIFANIVKNQLHVINYDSKQEKVKEALEIPLNSSNNSLGDLSQTLIKEGIFYFVPPSVYGEQLGSIIAINLGTFTLDYVGEFMIENPPDNGENIDIYFSRLE